MFCFGGSFNPIHYGHIRCAAFVAARQSFQRVVLIPSSLPPHKTHANDLASAEDRAAMCRLVAKDDPLFAMDEIELHRTGPSYTIDTVHQLHKRGERAVSWLIGADMLLDLPSWHRSNELINEVNFVIVSRPGWTMDWSRLPPAFQKLKSHVVEAPLVDISATDIRRRVRAGESIDGLVPASVAHYIAERGLYR